jgi:hypothetical protein
VEVPNPDSFGADLEDEVLNNSQAAYREILCGKAERQLTGLNWVVVSTPCDVHGASIDSLLGGSLGTYGTNWLMYKQTDYTGSNNNDMVMMDKDNDSMEPGKGYWLIVDVDKTMKMNTAVGGLSATTTQAKTNFTGFGSSSDSFEQVMEYSGASKLPDSQTDRKTKIMLGNPFIRTFKSGQIYFNNDALSQYYPLADANTANYVEQTLYAHDDSGLSAATSYYAITPAGTPGFGDAVDPMLGFWMLIKQSSGSANNSITYPLEKK